MRSPISWIEPEHRHGLGRIVRLPCRRVAGDVRLRCTLAQFNKRDLSRETQFLPGVGGWAGYAPGQALAWPYYHLGARRTGDRSASQAAAYEAVTLGQLNGGIWLRIAKQDVRDLPPVDIGHTDW